MVSTQEVRQLALSLPHAVEEPHFAKTSFRVKKKIFATMDLESKRVVVKLSEIDQSVFCDLNVNIIYPVKFAWGKQGWTTIELDKVKKSIMKDMVVTFYKTVNKGK